jgi:alcohol dehydrogenase
MKAAVLKAFGSKLEIEDVPNPIRGTGEVIVDVIATPVLPYAGEVFSGERKYLLNLPVIPGCGAIGRVRSAGPDATQLVKGDWVLCDPTVRSRDNALTPDITLQGWSARDQGGLRLQEYFHDGPFAEQIRIPTENAIRIGSMEARDALRWCALVTLLVPYGGLLAAGLQAGETLLVSGATGNYGSSAVAVALAMGAGCVIAPGRNETVLEDLVRRFGSRVRTVKLTGDEAKDRKSMMQAAPGLIDCVLDILPPSASTAAVRAAIMTVRPHGRVILMGGVGMLGGPGLDLAYPWIMRNLITVRGQWMYSPAAVSGLASLIRAGLLDLDQFSVTDFPLDRANDAVAHASATARAFNLTVVRP